MEINEFSRNSWTEKTLLGIQRTNSVQVKFNMRINNYKIDSIKENILIS